MNVGEIGDELIVKAAPIKMTKNLAFVDILLTTTKGNLLAKSSAIIKSTPRTENDKI